jgi:hypothetical protein
MNRTTALFLQVVIVLIGLAALTFLLGGPHLEGRNAHATFLEIYFKDPFLAYVYVGSIAFFVALYRAFGLFGSVRQQGSFAPESVVALRTIKRCGLTMIGFVAGAVVIILINGDPDDRPAAVFMSLLATLGSSAIAITAAKLERRVRSSVGGMA